MILGGLKFPIRDRGYGRGYQELANDTGAILIPNIFEGIMGNRKLMSDPIHPNDEGYRLIAERFYEAMLQLWMNMYRFSPGAKRIRGLSSGRRLALSLNWFGSLKIRIWILFDICYLVLGILFILNT